MALLQLLSSIFHFTQRTGTSSLWRDWFRNAMARNPKLLTEDNLAKDPERLLKICTPLCERLLKATNYPGAPVINPDNIESLLQYMYKRAVKIGLPLNTPLSSKGFHLGYSMGLVSLILPLFDALPAVSMSLHYLVLPPSSPSRGPGLCRPVYVAGCAVR